MLWRPSEGGGGGGGGGGVALPPAAGKAAPAAVRCGSALGEKQLHAPTCLCVLSPAPFFRALRKWVCMLYRHSLTASSEPVEALVSSLLWEAPMPAPGHISVQLGLGGEQMTFERPELSRELPEPPLPLGALLHALEPRQVLSLFRGALFEHRVLFVASNLSQLTAAAEALLSLLWPLRWQGIYIPLLPGLLVEVLQSPVPFVIGIHASTFASACRALPPMLPPDAFVANLDEGTRSS